MVFDLTNETGNGHGVVREYFFDYNNNGLLEEGENFYTPDVPNKYDGGGQNGWMVIGSYLDAGGPRQYDSTSPELENFTLKFGNVEYPQGNDDDTFYIMKYSFIYNSTNDWVKDIIRHNVTYIIAKGIRPVKLITEVEVLEDRNDTNDIAIYDKIDELGTYEEDETDDYAKFENFNPGVGPFERGLIHGNGNDDTFGYSPFGDQGIQVEKVLYTANGNGPFKWSGYHTVGKDSDNPVAYDLNLSRDFNSSDLTVDANVVKEDTDGIGAILNATGEIDKRTSFNISSSAITYTHLAWVYVKTNETSLPAAGINLNGFNGSTYPQVVDWNDKGTTRKGFLFRYNLTAGGDVNGIISWLWQNVTSCQEIEVANTLYNLTNNVSSNYTCFNITATNVTLDCQGYTINYCQNVTSYTGTVYYGVIVTGGDLKKSNITIKNCNILQESSDAVDCRAIVTYEMDNSTIKFINKHNFRK
jgi:hypothetical protein